MAVKVNKVNLSSLYSVDNLKNSRLHKDVDVQTGVHAIKDRELHPSISNSHLGNYLDCLA